MRGQRGSTGDATRPARRGSVHLLRRRQLPPTGSGLLSANHLRRRQPMGQAPGLSPTWHPAAVGRWHSACRATLVRHIRDWLGYDQNCSHA
jgi:hypothetical protein